MEQEEGKSQQAEQCSETPMSRHNTAEAHGNSQQPRYQDHISQHPGMDAGNGRLLREGGSVSSEKCAELTVPW